MRVPLLEASLLALWVPGGALRDQRLQLQLAAGAQDLGEQLGCQVEQIPGPGQRKFSCGNGCTDQTCLDVFLGPGNLGSPDASTRFQGTCKLSNWLRCDFTERALEVSPARQKQVAAVLWQRMMVQGRDDPWLTQCVIGAVKCFGEHSNMFVRRLRDFVFVGTTDGVRRTSLSTLLKLAETSPKAKEALVQVDSLRRKGYQAFTAAAVGRLKPGAAKSLKLLGTRFTKTQLRFSPDLGSTSYNERWAEQWRGTGLLVPLPPASTNVTCATLCALATPSVTEHLASHEELLGEFALLFGGTSKGPPPAKEYYHRFCTAYAELKGPVPQCALLSGIPKQPTPGDAGAVSAVPVYVMRMPAAVTFCTQTVAGRPVGTANQDCLRECQQGLSADFAAKTFRALPQKHPAVQRVCQVECQELCKQIMVKTADPPSFPGLVSYDVKQFRTAWASNKAFELQGVQDAATSRSASAAALGEVCTRNVVQLVEASMLNCCALSCGWNSTSRTCQGWNLLAESRKRDWWAECCITILVVESSDREAMCQSVEPSFQAWVQELNPRSTMEAFESGEDLKLPGADALLQEEAEVEMTEDVEVQVQEQPGTSPCRLGCADPAFLEDTLMQCSAAALQEWSALLRSPVGCGTPVVEQVTANPHECGQLATVNARTAAWTLLVSADPSAPSQGQCQLYRSCRSIVSSTRKAKMSNITETLWRQFSL